MSLTLESVGYQVVITHLGEISSLLFFQPFYNSVILWRRVIWDVLRLHLKDVFV